MEKIKINQNTEKTLKSIHNKEYSLELIEDEKLVDELEDFISKSFEEGLKGLYYSGTVHYIERLIGKGEFPMLKKQSPKFNHNAKTIGEALNMPEIEDIKNFKMLQKALETDYKGNQVFRAFYGLRLIESMLEVFKENPAIALAVLKEKTVTLYKYTKTLIKIPTRSQQVEYLYNHPEELKEIIKIFKDI